MRFLDVREAQQHFVDEVVSILHMAEERVVILDGSCGRCNHAGGGSALDANGRLNLCRMGISTLKEFIWRVWTIREDLGSRGL